MPKLTNCTALLFFLVVLAVSIPCYAQNESKPVAKANEVVRAQLLNENKTYRSQGGNKFYSTSLRYPRFVIELDVDADNLKLSSRPFPNRQILAEGSLVRIVGGVKVRAKLDDEALPLNPWTDWSSYSDLLPDSEILVLPNGNSTFSETFPMLPPNSWLLELEESNLDHPAVKEFEKIFNSTYHPRENSYFFCQFNGGAHNHFPGSFSIRQPNSNVLRRKLEDAFKEAEPSIKEDWIEAVELVGSHAIRVRKEKISSVDKLNGKNELGVIEVCMRGLTRASYIEVTAEYKSMPRLRKTVAWSEWQEPTTVAMSFPFEVTATKGVVFDSKKMDGFINFRKIPSENMAVLLKKLNYASPEKKVVEILSEARIEYMKILKKQKEDSSN